MMRIGENFRPRKWGDFYDDKMIVTVEERGSFCVYKKGYSGILFVFFHAAGSTSLSFAMLTQELCKNLKECQMLAIDMRGHGGSYTINDEDRTLITLTTDAIIILSKLYPTNMPQTVIVGHNVGSSIAIEVSKHLTNIIALVNLEGVEEYLYENLSTYLGIFHSVTEPFKSIDDAILWSQKQNLIGNPSSARISVPGLLWSQLTNKLASDEVNDAHSCTSLAAKSLGLIGNETARLCVRDDIITHISNASFQGKYVLRTDFSKLDQHCGGWYNKLSERFLRVAVPKIIILTTIHSLNPILMKAQMEGQFRYHVLPRKGFYVHEDSPAQISDIIIEFLHENNILYTRK